MIMKMLVWNLWSLGSFLVRMKMAYGIRVLDVVKNVFMKKCLLHGSKSAFLIDKYGGLVLKGLLCCITQ